MVVPLPASYHPGAAALAAPYALVAPYALAPP
jgi:hypothetical protein